MCIIKVLPKFRTQLLTNKGEKNNKAGRGWGWGSMGDKNQMVIDHRKSKKNKIKKKVNGTSRGGQILKPSLIPLSERKIGCAVRKPNCPGFKSGT